MYNFSAKIDLKPVDIYCAQNDDEKTELRTLIRETEIIVGLIRSTGSTGMYIVDVFETEYVLYVAMTFRKKYDFSESDIKKLRSLYQVPV